MQYRGKNKHKWLWGEAGLIATNQKKKKSQIANTHIQVSLNGYFSRVLCIFNSVTHQQTNKFCMKWRGEKKRVSPW
jgi:hypothetical protein